MSVEVSSATRRGSFLVILLHPTDVMVNLSYVRAYEVYNTYGGLRVMVGRMSKYHCVAARVSIHAVNAIRPYNQCRDKER